VEQLQGCIGVSPTLTDNVQHFGFVIHSAPEEHRCQVSTAINGTG
jgi:hypothetical protein